MSEANGPTTFADSGQSVIERELEVESVQHSDLESLYEIERTVERILEGGYSRIALQFPDELLADAANLATLLRDRTKKDIFVLADTSYGSCCVDEVAAEHVNADLVIHYGRSCLSPWVVKTVAFPDVLYLFLAHHDCPYYMCLGNNRWTLKIVWLLSRTTFLTRNPTSYLCATLNIPMQWVKKLKKIKKTTLGHRAAY